MGTQQFCLRWNNHQSNMLNTFESLLHNEALVDVTLACEGLSLKAHKVVLSACSPYFQSLFIENPCKHPIVILKDVRYSDLKALVDFMYKGEVNVSQEQLNALLNTAEALKIKGLAEVTGGGFSCVNSTQLEPLSLSRTQGPRDPPTPPLVESRRSQPPPLPHLQPLPNPPGMVPMAPSSPPPKRRKTKPRKRIPESAIISDQEDSDAVDLVTTTPEMIETCVDIPESSSEGERAMEPTESKNVPLLEQSRSNEAENSQQHPPPSLPPPPPPPPPLPSAIASAEGAEDRSPLGETKGFHKLFSNTNQNQTVAACVSSPSSLPTQRLPMLSKSSLISVLPPSSSSPVPSTSTTQATIQDPAGWPERKRREYHCEHCQMSFESKKVFYKHGCPRVRVGFTCEVCGSYFPTHCRYSRHKQIHNPDREIYTCYYCPKTMVRMDHLKQHMKNAHGTL